MVSGTRTTGVPGGGVRQTVRGTANTNNTGFRRIACRNCNPNKITIVIFTLASGGGQATTTMHSTFARSNNSLNTDNSISCVFSHGNLVRVLHSNLSGDRSSVLVSTLSTNTRSVGTASSGFRVFATPDSVADIHSTLRRRNCRLSATRMAVVPRGAAIIPDSGIDRCGRLVSRLASGSSITSVCRTKIVRSSSSTR